MITWKHFTIFTFAICAAFLAVSLLVTATAEAKTWYVDDDGGADFKKIQDAIDAAVEGDTIMVESGIYNEDLYMDPKHDSIDLIGEGPESTIINGSGTKEVVKIYGYWVNMSGFSVTGGSTKGTGILFYSWYGTLSDIHSFGNSNGISVDGRFNVIAESNCSFNKYSGISTRFAEYVIVRNSTCCNNGRSGINGDSGRYSHNTYLDNNCSFNNGSGITGYSSGEVQDSYDSFIRNTCLMNSDYGIRAEAYSTIENNTCLGNRGGILAKGNSRISNNSCSNNREDGINIAGGGKAEDVILFNNRCWGNGLFGIYLNNAVHSSLLNNTCSSNGMNGITVLASRYVIIRNNSCSYNTKGIHIKDPNDLDVTNNHCSWNEIGIFLSCSERSKDRFSLKLTNNTLTKNSLYINPNSWLAFWDENIRIENNTINEKLLFYRFNETEIVVPENVGQIVLLRCADVLIRGLNLSNMHCPLLAQYCSYVRIIENTFSNNNESGILLEKGHNSTVAENFFEGNGKGLESFKEENLTIRNNIFRFNTEAGIFSHGGYRLSIENNTLFGNKIGIHVWVSVYGKLANNTCVASNETGIHLQWAYAFKVVDNVCFNNGDGLRMVTYTELGFIERNYLHNNSNGLVFSGSNINWNQVNNNTIENNERGFLVNYLERSTKNHLHFNEFAGNKENVEFQSSVKVILNLSNNWWGHASGPYNKDENPKGKGASVPKGIIFKPWLERLKGHEPPVAEIESIIHKPNFDGGNVTFTAGTSNGDGIEAYIWTSSLDRELYNGSASSFTYSNLSIGDHTITLTVVDIYGIPSTEVSTTLGYIPRNKLPDTIFTSPDDGSIVKDKLTIQGSSKDEDGYIERVELSIDNGSWLKLASPGNVSLWSWSYDWDTTTVEDGDYSIVVRSFDGRNYSEERTITVTVKNKKGTSDEVGFLPAFELTILVAGLLICLALKKKQN